MFGRSRRHRRGRRARGCWSPPAAAGMVTKGVVRMSVVVAVMRVRHRRRGRIRIVRPVVAVRRARRGGRGRDGRLYGLGAGCRVGGRRRQRWRQQYRERGLCGCRRRWWRRLRRRRRRRWYAGSGTRGGAGSSHTGGLLAAPAPTVTTSSALQIDTATPQNGSVSFTYTVPNGPSASISNPAGGATYTRDQVVDTQFSCAEGVFGPGLSGCKDSNGASATITSGEQSTGTIDGTLNTATTGLNTYTVTATSADGLTTTTSMSYTVGNNPPTATISSPASGGVYYQGESVPTSSRAQKVGAPRASSSAKTATASSPRSAAATGRSTRAHWASARTTSSRSRKTGSPTNPRSPTSSSRRRPPRSRTPRRARHRRSLTTRRLTCPSPARRERVVPASASCDGYNETTIDTIDTSSGGSGLLDTSNTGSSVYTVVAISNDGARTSTNFTYKVADPPTATIISPAPTAGNPTYFAGGSGSGRPPPVRGRARAGLGISDCSDGTTSGRTGTITGKLRRPARPGNIRTRSRRHLPMDSPARQRLPTRWSPSRPSAT